MMTVDFQNWQYASIAPKASEIFLYWHSSLPYATHKNRWTGGYVPATYCYYPPNLPGRFFTEEHIAAPPGKVIVGMTPRVLSIFDEGNPEGVPSSPVLITPVRQKKYDAYKLTIQELWSSAIKALEEANRIVIIGYSFPPTDTRSVDLFRGVLSSRGKDLAVEIVAPGVNDIVKRIGEEYVAKAKDVTLHDKRFEEYIDELTESTPTLMRKAAEENPEVGEWLKRIYAMSKRRIPSAHD